MHSQTTKQRQDANHYPAYKSTHNIEFQHNINHYPTTKPNHDIYFQHDDNHHPTTCHTKQKANGHIIQQPNN